MGKTGKRETKRKRVAIESIPDRQINEIRNATDGMGQHDTRVQVTWRWKKEGGLMKQT